MSGLVRQQRDPVLYNIAVEPSKNNPCPDFRYFSRTHTSFVRLGGPTSLPSSFMCEVFILFAHRPDARVDTHARWDLLDCPFWWFYGVRSYRLTLLFINIICIKFTLDMQFGILMQKVFKFQTCAQTRSKRTERNANLSNSARRSASYRNNNPPAPASR